MSTLTFAQTTRRNLAGPILLALVLLAIAGVLVYRSIPHTDAAATITHVIVHPAQVVLKAQPGNRAFKVLKQQSVTETELYIIPTVHIDDHLGVPLFLKDFHVVVATPDRLRHGEVKQQVSFDELLWRHARLAQQRSAHQGLDLRKGVVDDRQIVLFDGAGVHLAALGQPPVRHAHHRLLPPGLDHDPVSEAIAPQPSTHETPLHRR